MITRPIRPTEPASGTRVRIGTLPHPGRAALHPGHAAVTAAEHAWLVHSVPFTGELRKETFLAERIPRRACWSYPTAEPARLGSISRLHTLLYAFADPAAHGWEAYDDVLRTLDGTGDDTSPFATAYRDARADLTGSMTAGVRRRYARAHRRWAEALVMENSLRAGGHTAHPDVCFPLRRIACGGETALVPVEHGLGIDLTELMERDADLAGLWRVAGTHMALVGDLFSLRRELLTGDGPNLPLSLMRHQGLTVQGAVDVLLRRLEDAGDTYTRACRTLRARHRDHGLSGDLDRYLEAVGRLIAGNLAWHYESRRHHGPGHTWDGRPPTALVLHPDRTEFEYDA
ncbi:terpene synthase family protein [Streptomyces poonensis]|uniref:Terpene synthase n=1 Tax=Streptomyces poonensis TaxID=68255 RepID=A0A918UCI2_9ACTN|nr:terpene synthase family protein [Streptomyces poonensis]GGY87671.1 hypothetical protein GCM10010365_02100 [Streptomyces poonensis]GLJ90250.1 hypothetical protein GCM10017589_28530 [Streptomyces poonensis]